MSKFWNSKYPAGNTIPRDKDEGSFHLYNYSGHFRKFFQEQNDAKFNQGAENEEQLGKKSAVSEKQEEDELKKQKVIDEINRYKAKKKQLEEELETQNKEFLQFKNLKNECLCVNEQRKNSIRIFKSRIQDTLQSMLKIDKEISSFSEGEQEYANEINSLSSDIEKYKKLIDQLEAANSPPQSNASLENIEYEILEAEGTLKKLQERIKKISGKIEKVKPFLKESYKENKKQADDTGSQCETFEPKNKPTEEVVGEIKELTDEFLKLKDQKKQFKEEKLNQLKAMLVDISTMYSDLNDVRKLTEEMTKPKGAEQSQPIKKMNETKEIEQSQPKEKLKLEEQKEQCEKEKLEDSIPSRPEKKLEREQMQLEGKMWDMNKTQVKIGRIETETQKPCKQSNFGNGKCSRKPNNRRRRK